LDNASRVAVPAGKRKEVSMETIATASVMPRRRLGDVKAVADRSGMSVRSVYRYADAGLMPWGVKIGSLRRWDMDEIERWIADGCKPVRKGAAR
jgi:predicted DNA-binding transcriptional regulator AlpA